MALKLMKRLMGKPKDGNRAQEKWQKRKEKFESSRWQKESELARRHYANYEEYLEHQSSKLDRIKDRLERHEEDAYADFLSRFASCEPLTSMRNVLCLGARLGTEVKAFHALGKFAVGLDLNPGPDNKYVLPGDFHAVVFPDGSVDAVYTNALDHAFELERLVMEVKRLLRPGGIFVIDHVKGFEEGFVPGEYESLHWDKSDTLIRRVCAAGGFELVHSRKLDTKDKYDWIQSVVRRPA
jgi:SAM-dependent methyltransferase